MVTWKLHKGRSALAPTTVDLWTINLADFSPHLNLLWEMLSEQEQKHTARFRFDHDRRSFVLAYGILRLLLARNLNCSPHVLCYDGVATSQVTAVAHHYAPKTKRQPVYSSIAYTSEAVIIAISSHHAVSVDIKGVVEIPEQAAIIENYFSPRESQLLLRMPEELRTPMFYTYLARKCAFSKAQADGFALPLQQIDSAPAAHGLAQEADADGLLDGWQIESLQVDAAHAGAVAIDAVDSVINYHVATSEQLLGRQYTPEFATA